VFHERKIQILLRAATADENPCRTCSAGENNTTKDAIIIIAIWVDDASAD
jgi:hypothetical protein